MLFSAGDALAGTKETDREAAEQLVREALHREWYGLSGERHRMLEDAARQAPDFGLAHWYLGHVRERGEWRTVESIIDQSEPTPAEKEYALKRTDAKDTIEDHLTLANRCRELKLEAQERAHLTRILDLDPDHAVARSRLGFVNVRGEWVSQAEARALAERDEKEDAAELRWRPVLLDVRRGIVHESPQRRQAARDKLNQIKDPHAIRTLESVLSASGEEAALAVVDWLDRLNGQGAVDSLIRHAVLSPSPLVREAAANKLRSRQRESFVPKMIAQMYGLTSSSFQVVPLPDGRLGYRHVAQREGQDERQLIVLDTAYRRVARMGGDSRETLFRAFTDSVVGAVQRELAVAQQNELQLAMNQRLAEALNIATNQQLPADPQRWWQWWDEENDMFQQGDKPVHQRQQFRQISVQDRRPPEFPGRQSPGVQTAPPPRQRCECFAAGTVVLTRSGEQAIETIQVGDLVLSQHPNTGELAFKPVLRTTVRPPSKLIQLQVGQDTLETTRGHLFWVSGHGWSQSQQLDSGSQLHCLRGSQSIGSIEEGAEAETYNLVVADFHTYFVGSQRVLSHDVTIRQPTRSLVPGLVP
jgi:hypothetical protein